MAASFLALLRRHTGTGVLLLAAAVVAVLAGPPLVLGPEVAVEEVVRRDFVQSVLASGRVEAPHRVDVGVQVTGTVVRVPVREGQAVAAGTPLVELEASELRATLSQNVLALRQAEARVRQVREVQAPVAEQALVQARANDAMAQQTLERNRALVAKGFLSQSALDDATRAAQVAGAQVRTAEQQLAGARPSGSDAALAEAARAQAQAGVEVARSRLAYATVAAPVAGTLIARNVEPGHVVQPGKALMVLSPAGETQLVVLIDEKNLRLLRLGQKALASADAYPQQRFDAELFYINPGVDVQRGSVQVKLRVPSPPDYLRQDMTVSVDIEVARSANAVLVPGDAVRDADSAAPWVLKAEAGRATRQAVKLGLRSSGLAQVLEGLQAGDRVVPVGALTVLEGARLRPVAAAAGR